MPLTPKVRRRTAFPAKIMLAALVAIMAAAACTSFQAPEIKGIRAWINSEPLTIEGLRGKVVLVEKAHLASGATPVSACKLCFLRPGRFAPTSAHIRSP